MRKVLSWIAMPIFAFIMLFGVVYTPRVPPKKFMVTRAFSELTPGEQVDALKAYVDARVIHHSRLASAASNTSAVDSNAQLAQRYAQVSAALDAYLATSSGLLSGLADEEADDALAESIYKPDAALEFAALIPYGEEEDLVAFTVPLVKLLEEGDVTHFPQAYRHAYGVAPELVASQYKGELVELVNEHLLYDLTDYMAGLRLPPGIYIVNFIDGPLPGFIILQDFPVVVPTSGFPHFEERPSPTSVDLTDLLRVGDTGFSLLPWVVGIGLLLSVVLLLITRRRVHV